MRKNSLLEKIWKGLKIPTIVSGTLILSGLVGIMGGAIGTYYNTKRNCHELYKSNYNLGTIKLNNAQSETMAGKRCISGNCFDTRKGINYFLFQLPADLAYKKFVEEIQEQGEKYDAYDDIMRDVNSQ